VITETDKIAINEHIKLQLRTIIIVN